MMQIALDPGYGNTKVAVDGQAVVLQSALSRVAQIGRAADGLKLTEAATCQVETQSGTYAAGRNAWFHGEPVTGSMDYTSLASEPRRVLFYGALSQALPGGEYEADLTIGLPVPLLRDAAQSDVVLESLKGAYKGRHAFQVGGQHYALEIRQLNVLAQPVGAWADWMIGENLRPRAGGKDAEIAVLDIGMNTIDLMVVCGGKIEPRFVGGAARAGVRSILPNLNGNGEEIEELDDVLRSGRKKLEPMVLENWCSAILGHVEKTWPAMKRFAAVIPAGGGAAVLGRTLYSALIAHGATLACPSDPVTANVLGLWKWAAYSTSRRTK